MFLFERIFGVAVYSIVVFFFTINISKAKSMKAVKRYLIGFIIILAMMGYFYLPYVTADLYFIKNLIMNNYQYKSWNEILEYVQNSRFMIYHIIYWAFGKLGNPNLLPAFVSFAFYSNCFYIIYKSALKFNFSPKTISMIVLFLMAGGQFVEVISGIRSMFAFSIIALCCYQEFFEKKSFLTRIPLYILASLIHDAALILFLIRTVFLIMQPEKKLVKKLANFVLLIIALVFSLTYFQDYISRVLSHGSNYVNGNVYFYIWEFIIAISCLIFMYYSVSIVNRVIRAKIRV